MLLLLDASGYIYQAFHGMPQLVRNDGQPTGAILGYCTSLWALVRNPPAPYTHIAAVFDGGGRTWRHDVDPNYKLRRLDKKPDDIGRQFALIREATTVFGVARLEVPGVEADDVIATYARRARQIGLETVVVSGDKDMMQLVNPPLVRVYNSHPRRKDNKPVRPYWVDEARILEKFGVAPRLVPDAQGLIGDSSDEYTGVPGCGPKSAANLLASFGTVEGVIEAAQAGKIAGAIGKAVAKHSADAVKAKILATLDVGVDLDVPIADLEARLPSASGIVEFLDKMQIVELSDRVMRELPMVAAKSMYADAEAMAG